MNGDPFVSEREHMVLTQIKRRNVRNARVLEAMRTVPRHIFVPPEERYLAYADCALPIGSGQTISQPYIVALMSEKLALKGNEKVLEVGTGSGYQAAVLAQLAKVVHTIERRPELAHQAERLLKDLGLANVQVHIGDGSLGLPNHAPYKAIIVTAAAPHTPHPLLDQLEDGGRLVIPVGGRGNQFLECWIRQGEQFTSEEIIPVAFVPLVGEQAWKEF